MWLLILLIIAFPVFTPGGTSESDVIGGKRARHSRPYMVSLQNADRSHVCGGFLIRRNFVLTSAHCLSNKLSWAVLGADNITASETTQQRMRVKHFHRHPLAPRDKTRYDIMLVELKKHVTLNDNVKIIGLSTNSLVLAKCSVAGWGMLKSKSTASDVLMQVPVEMMDNQRCKKIWQKYFDTKQMLCAPSKQGKGFCQGDSGGPLVCKGKAYGIVAYNWVEQCASDKPDVYMNVSYFVPWIEEVLNRTVSQTTEMEMRVIVE